MKGSMCFVLVCSLCVILSSACCAETLVETEAIIRPTRPKNFMSPDDLREYLDQLGQYYSVVGRPRFGKRVAVNRQESLREDLPVSVAVYEGASRRQHSVPSDMFKLLQDYQLQAI